jgi:hypothetical protein
MLDLETLDDGEEKGRTPILDYTGAQKVPLCRRYGIERIGETYASQHMNALCREGVKRATHFKGC